MNQNQPNGEDAKGKRDVLNYYQYCGYEFFLIG